MLVLLVYNISFKHKFLKGTCGKTAQNVRELNNFPDIVTIGVIWESNSISENSLNEFYKCIKPSFEIQDVNSPFKFTF
jgi:hypothetical protein